MSIRAGTIADGAAVKRARRRYPDAFTEWQLENPHVFVSLDHPLWTLAPAQQRQLLARRRGAAVEGAKAGRAEEGRATPEAMVALGAQTGSEAKGALGARSGPEARSAVEPRPGRAQTAAEPTIAASASARDPWSVVFYLLGVVPFALLVTYLDGRTLLAVGAVSGTVGAYLAWSYVVVEFRPAWGRYATAPQAMVAAVLVGVAAGWLGWIPHTVFGFTALGALALFVCYYWFITLLAVYHRQTTATGSRSAGPYPTITVLVPAYNERGYVGQTLRALLAADYPVGKRDVVVVDDGSTDGTYEEALAFESADVKVVRKTNGGKYSALNYGLLFATGEVVVAIDADSLVHPTALRAIVEPFRADPSVGAVASHVKVLNPGSLLTACQQLEYVVGMNVYRRMLDLFGAVTIVPGCLGAFRRSVVEGAHAYDPDTLAEDFDVTLKVLEAGYRVAVSDAVVYTEVPATWADLYRQRLRWYRGNVMTVYKHWRLLRDHSTGYVGRLAFPLRVIELFVLPPASLLILASIVLGLLQGAVVTVLALFVFFTSVVVLISLVALQIEGEDRTLAVYAPLFVLGYKHLLDLLTLKSLVDVTLGRELSWTRAARVGQRPRQGQAQRQEST